MVRSFPVFEQTHVDFRAEYFDVLNHTELANPQASASSTAFGTITGTVGGPNGTVGGSRVAQFSLKYVF